MSLEQIIIWTFITGFLVIMGGAIITVWFEELTAPFKRIFKPKPKYRIGQKVRVRGDLTNHKEYGNRTVYRAMMEHVGNVVTIANIRSSGKEVCYDIEEDWEDVWHADMFIPFIITKENAFEHLLHGHISDEEYSEIMNGGGVVNYVRSWRKNRTHR